MSHSVPTLAIVGGGPAGLMAAESAASSPLRIQLYDAMPSVGRKFLLTGKGGLNLTHSEPLAQFIHRYEPLPGPLETALHAFPPQSVRDWAASLGIETFIGTSMRVFPKDFKSAPLLRAWLRRLRESGVEFHTRHRWTGFDAHGDLCFETPSGPHTLKADAVILALGGASWPQLGSNGAWVEHLTRKRIDITPLAPANCRYVCRSLSEDFYLHHAGQPIKTIRLGFEDDSGQFISRPGELIITTNGIEGGPVYALSSRIRHRLESRQEATVWLDLCPDRSLERLHSALQEPRGSRSFPGYLKRKTGLDGIKLSLLRACLPASALSEAARLSEAIKRLPLVLTGPGSIDTAISTAGGVCFSELDDHLMLNKLPGVFVAGEMLDYDAPTGGYLLTACLATGRMAGLNAAAWLMR